MGEQRSAGSRLSYQKWAEIGEIELNWLVLEREAGCEDRWAIYLYPR